MSAPDDLAPSLLPEKDVPVLVDAIKSIMAEGDAHNLQVFNQSRWEWQYVNLPSYKSRVYVNHYKEKILAYYHVPLYYGKAGPETITFAMVQDVAVSVRFRGRGVFKELATYATEDLMQRNIGLAYTFPNNKSIHTFIKYNDYKLLTTLVPYLLPLNSAAILKIKLPFKLLASLSGGIIDFFNNALRKIKVPESNSIERHESFSKEIAGLFFDFQAQYEVGLIRDEVYLNWRFLEKPQTKHYIFSLNVDGKPAAAAVFKVDELFDNSSLLLMDFCYCKNGEEYLLQLLQSLRANYKRWIKEPVTLIFTSGNGKIFPLLKKAGFIKIPERINPRPLNLLVKGLNYKGLTDITDKTKWHVTLADWDVF